MKTEAKLFAFVTVFFLIVTPVYYFMSREPAGTAVLALSFFLGLMLTAYLALVARRIDDRPEDRSDGDIVDGSGTLGFFPPKSIWPFICALVFSIIFLGPVFGWWISLVGFGLGIWAVSGWVYEFYRGDYAH